MKKSDVFCWVVIGLLLLFLWHSSSIEFFQDTSGIKGPPYTASDATKIVSVMPTTMKTALKTSTGSDEPSRLIQPITDIMSDFHAVYASATVPLKAADVDTFLLTKTIPTGVTKADMKTLLVAYFVTPAPGAANAPLTAAQTAANTQAAARAAATAANASTYASQLAAVGQSGGYSDASANRLSLNDASANRLSLNDASANRLSLNDASANRIPFSSSFGISGGGGGTPMSGMQVGGPTYGGLGSNANNLATAAGNWASVGSNYPTMYGPSTTATPLPNANPGLVLPTADQAGVYMPGHRAPSQLGTFVPLQTQKMDGDPSGFWPDYRVFMK
jgi:hypothetical protein